MNWDMPHDDMKRNSNYGMVKRKKMDSSTQNKKIFNHKIKRQTNHPISSQN